MWACAHTLRVYKVFTEMDQGLWLKKKLCLGPAGVIKCTRLSTLSFGVSLLPGTFGYNIWCIGQEAPHFEETSPTWGYSESLWLGSSRGGKASHPPGEIPFLNAWTFHIGG